MQRRAFLITGTAMTAATIGGIGRAVEGERFEVTKTDAEWRAMLSDLEYQVMRQEGTERAGTSPLDKLYQPGTYLCRGCELPLYSSEAKYDSGTGWPSFWEALPNAVANKPDRKFLIVRTEEHCRRCGSHLGHVFDDGPAPTGKRHCINGVSLVFQPA